MRLQRFYALVGLSVDKGTARARVVGFAVALAWVVDQSAERAERALMAPKRCERGLAVHASTAAAGDLSNAPRAGEGQSQRLFIEKLKVKTLRWYWFICLWFWLALPRHMRSHRCRIALAYAFGYAFAWSFAILLFLHYSWLMSEYELRVEAARQGQKRYKGKPCLEHANAERYTSNGACVECTRVRSDHRQEEIRDLLKRNAP